MRLPRGRLSREHRTLSHLVGIYCRQHHGGGAPCPACDELTAYAGERLRRCPYGALKATCANCPVHCYKPARRAQVREIMRYAGPRMLFRHPWLALRHWLDGLRRVDHPMALRRRTEGRRA